jgi:hypothetical protein
MSEPCNQSEAEFRKYRRDYLRRWFPNHVGEIALGDELLTFLSDRTNQITQEIHRRFWSRRIAIMGDSAGGIRFGARDGDLVCHQFMSASQYTPATRRSIDSALISSLASAALYMPSAPRLASSASWLR